MGWAIVIFLIVTGFLAFSVISIRSGIFIKSITKSPFDGGILTFDDGPHPIYTPQILDLLDKYQLKAIFFCIGKNAEQHPELVRRIADSGHLLGNHTYSHSVASTFYGPEKYLAEINTTTRILENISRQKIKYFRPPFGITNPSIAKAIHKSGLKSMAWNIRTFDTTTDDASKLCRKVKKYWNRNSIILFHDRLEVAVDAVSQLLSVNGLTGYAQLNSQIKNQD